MPVGAIVSGVASIGSSVAGGLMGSAAANRAGQLAQQAGQQGNKLIGDQMSANTANLSPYTQAGANDTNALQGLLGVGGNPAAAAQAWNQYRNSTNYQFRLDQGLQGMEYANAPAFSSSATAKALNNYAQGEAGNALGGYEQLLQGGAGLGAQSALGLGQLNTGAAMQQSGNLLAAAGAQGSAGMAGANAWGNALHGISSGISSFANGLGGQGGMQANPMLPNMQTSSFYNPGTISALPSMGNLSSAIPGGF